jgi:hypothetical protein
MTEQEEELDRGGFRTAGFAVGAMGALGIAVGLVMMVTEAGDPRIVEAQGMAVTGLVLGVVGSGMWWWGARP